MQCRHGWLGVTQLEVNEIAGKEGYFYPKPFFKIGYKHLLHFHIFTKSIHWGEDEDLRILLENVS